MRGGRRGFSLIEITLVVIIFALLAAIGLPRFKGTFAQARLKSSARALVGSLRYARNAAVLRGLPTEVRFHLAHGGYELTLLDEYELPVAEREPGRRWRDEDGPRVLTDDVRGVRRLPETVEFAFVQTSAAPSTEHDDPRVVYYPDGSATPAVIGLIDPRERGYSIQVFRTTGMARIGPGIELELEPTKPIYYGPNKR